jgi:hypothetical protein
MRPTILAVSSMAALFLIAAPAWSRQDQQQKPASKDQRSSAVQDRDASQAQASVAQEGTLAEAARKAREQRKEAPKAARVFTNDNIPTAGGISAVGTAPEPAASGKGAEGQAKTGASAASTSPNDEKTWRARFATLRHKLEQDQAELSIMQRELGVLNLQYYPDPNKQMQQQLTREDIDKKTSAIEAKKKQVEADQQAISDAEDDLRKAGGDPGWASPQ